MVLANELVARLADIDIDPASREIPPHVIAASERIAAVYSDLLARGVSNEMIARSMLGATVSLYDAIGFLPVLPDVLRTVADKIEAEVAASRIGRH